MTSSVLTTPAPPRPALRSWFPAFLVLAAIWGASFAFIKVGIRELHPVQLAFYRCSAGALVLLAAVALRRDRLPGSPRLWLRMAAIALIGNAIPFTLFGFAEQRVSSVVAGIWNATTPLMVLIVVVLVLTEERPSPARVVGLVLGFTGVLVVLGVWRGLGGSELLGQLMCAAAAACYGISIPATKRVITGRTESGVALAAVQVSLAALELGVITVVLNGTPPTPAALSIDVLSSALALGMLGTGVAFILNYRVIRVAGATTSASVTYLVPVFATALGVLTLGEPLHWYEPAGALVILAGVAISQLGARRRRASQPLPDPVSALVPTPAAAARATY